MSSFIRALDKTQNCLTEYCRAIGERFLPFQIGKQIHNKNLTEKISNNYFSLMWDSLKERLSLWQIKLEASFVTVNILYPITPFSYTEFWLPWCKFDIGVSVLMEYMLIQHSVQESFLFTKYLVKRLFLRLNHFKMINQNSLILDQP